MNLSYVENYAIVDFFLSSFVFVLELKENVVQDIISGGLISNTRRRLLVIRNFNLCADKKKQSQRQKQRKAMSEKLVSMIAAENYTYVAVKGSPFANDCAVFGLSKEESLALTTRFPNSGQPVVNGVTIKGEYFFFFFYLTE